MTFEIRWKFLVDDIIKYLKYHKKDQIKFQISKTYSKNMDIVEFLTYIPNNYDYFINKLNVNIKKHNFNVIEKFQLLCYISSDTYSFFNQNDVWKRSSSYHYKNDTVDMVTDFYSFLIKKKLYHYNLYSLYQKINSYPDPFNILRKYYYYIKYHNEIKNNDLINSILMLNDNSIHELILSINEKNYIQFSELYKINYSENAQPFPYLCIEELLKRVNLDDYYKNDFFKLLKDSKQENLIYYNTINTKIDGKLLYKIPVVTNYNMAKDLILHDSDIIWNNKTISDFFKPCSDENALINTLNYFYYEMRSGIYCEIVNNELRKFFIFVNPNYENTWHQNINFLGIKNFKNMTLDDMIRHKKEIISLNEYKEFKSYFLSQVRKKYKKPENYLPVKNWWSNAYIIDNVIKYYDDDPIIGKNHCDVIIDMILQTLKMNKITNTRFFFNKRDHPMLRKDLTQSYKFLYKSKTDIPNQYKKDGFIKIISWTGSEYFSDVLSPNVDDWVTTCNYVPNTSENFSSKTILENRNKLWIDWENRNDKIIFLGSSTGNPRRNKNQRMMLVDYVNSLPESEKIKYDVGITLINYRDKISEPCIIEFTMDDFPLHERIEMVDQMKYKYVISVPGHSAPYRYLTLFYLGFLVFRVDPPEERMDIETMWCDLYLDPFKDYVPIKSDLSDLNEKVNYYIQHQDECKKILNNVKLKLENELSRNGMIDHFKNFMNLY
jgi:hypothetical protein